MSILHQARVWDGRQLHGIRVSGWARRRNHCSGVKSNNRANIWIPSLEIRTFHPGGISWFSWYTKISNGSYDRVSQFFFADFQVDENLALLQFWGAFGDCLHTQITFIYVGLLAIVPALTNCMYVPNTVNSAIIQRTCLCLSVWCIFHTLDKTNV